MKVVAVSELRQKTAEILDELRASEEPVVILQRSQKAAYLVDATTYEAQQAELQATRRALFLREVREAEAEYSAGDVREYDDVEALLIDLRG